MLVHNKIKKTEQEAYQRLSALCVTAEYCLADMRKKMARWELVDEEGDPMNENAEERILKRLVQERFVDENRFAHAYVRDKSRYNRWGRIRIEQELRRRNIPVLIIEDALTELVDEDNLNTLRTLIERKRPSVKGKNDYEIRMKLIRFALSRGFVMDDIRRVLNTDVEDYEDIDIDN